MLHVLISPVCNNHCAFCMESDRDRRRAHTGGQSDDDVRAMLEAYPERDEVLFTSGEPTLNPHLLGWLQHARRLRYRQIALITNGRRLAYEPYARALIQAGVTRITLSIHAHQARLHDGLTRVRGSFDQSWAGLMYLSALKTRARFDLHTSTVVTRRNLPHLAAIHAHLKPLSIDRMVFNVMMAQGLGEAHFERLMPAYADAATAMAALVAPLPPDEVRRLSLMDVPACVTEGLPPEVRGQVEAYEQYEALGSTGNRARAVVLADRDWELYGPPVEDADTTALRAEVQQVDLACDHAYHLARRQRKDGHARAYRADCQGCRYRPACPGVWRVYAERRGWDEFVPVPAGAGG